VDAGVVSFSGQIAGVGIVSVRHASGLRSTYQPVGDRVPEGSRIRRGERLGVLEVGGHCVLLDCLHLGARRGDTYVDPTPLLHPVVLSLLPLEPAPRGP
jgi:murein DD-endopeptidase MepM/ murein hydrolase activator NlpD